MSHTALEQKGAGTFQTTTIKTHRRLTVIIIIEKGYGKSLNYLELQKQLRLL